MAFVSSRLCRKWLRSCLKHCNWIALAMMIFIIYLSLGFTFHILSPRSINTGSPMRVFKRKDASNSKLMARKNLVFIKQMKCATSTMIGTIYRFGYTHNLTFVSPLKRNLYLNWPYKLTRKDFRPSSSGYNILTDHSIYTPEVMKAIMPNDTIYVSIIRHPMHQALSMFQYFKPHVIAGVPESATNPFITYFSDIEYYEKQYKRQGAPWRSCIPDGFSMTKNLMSHCLGMPLGFPPGSKDISNDLEKVDDYIRYIDINFNLIMIVEYFYESIILLRRLMHWKFSDILFVKSNVGRYSFDTKHIPLNILDIHKNWTSIDYRLYEYFNTTFWKHVYNQSNDFFDEVKKFMIVEENFNIYCQSIYPLGKRAAYRYPKDKEILYISSSKWNEAFSVTPEDCWMLGPNPYKMMEVVQTENDFKEAVLLRNQESIKDNRKLKALC